MLTAAAGSAGERLALEYFYDENGSSLSLYGLGFADNQHGIAAGVLERSGRAKGAAVVTRDGGRSWSLVPLPAPAAWLWVDSHAAWFGDGSRVWKSTDLGASWRRARGLERISRVYFANQLRGWAIGWRDTVLETSDGGDHWTAVETGVGKDRRDNTAYTDIALAGKYGLITGEISPERPRSRLPEWADPAAVRRELPTTALMLQTQDGGKTWTQTKASVFGRISRIQAGPDGSALMLVEFLGRFSYPSEVYLLSPKGGSVSGRAFRRADRAVTDIAFAGGTAWLVAVEPPGQMLRAPVPGKLKLLRSSGMQSWTELDVDYRAVAQHAVCALAAGRLWVATDTGMLLSVRSDQE